MGGVSAAVSKTAAAPIERVKLLIQNQVSQDSSIIHRFFIQPGTQGARKKRGPEPVDTSLVISSVYRHRTGPMKKFSRLVHTGSAGLGLGKKQKTKTSDKQY